jgi:Cof subfamily protein (haloacid dehalogenase superfamily)
MLFYNTVYIALKIAWSSSLIPDQFGGEYMAFKMLFLDIDGTLLNSNHQISSETKHAIRSLPKDFPVVLVSARMPKGITFLYKELGLKTPIICYSGALVMDMAYQPILNKTLTLQQMKMIYQQAGKRNVHIGFYKDDDWYVEDLDDWVIQEEKIAKTSPAIIDFSTLFHGHNGANKVLCMGNAAEIEDLEFTLKNTCSEHLTIYRSKPEYLEIMHHTVTKTSAIQFLLENFNIQKGEIIAIGDNFNDIDMIQFAGLGVAMGNAPEPVKQLANEITLSNDDNGVARIIHKYLLSRME